MTATTSMTETEAAAVQETELDLRMIPVDEIRPDPNQPRRTFDAKAIDDLGASLKTRQTNAIRVRPLDPDEEAPEHGVKFIIMQGERRWRAAKKAGLTHLRAEVESNLAPQDPELLLEQIMDNQQREDVGAVEEAAAIRRYAKLTGSGTREIATKIGKGQGYVSFALAMNDMPAKILKRIESDARGTASAEAYPMTWRHLRHLVRLKDHPVALETVYDNAVSDRASSRELEHMVDQELEWIEQKRATEKREKEAAAAAQGGKPMPTKIQAIPLSHLSEKEKHEALVRARMTRARKDLIRGTVPEIVGQVAQIAKKIQLPPGVAAVAAAQLGLATMWSLSDRDGQGRRTAGASTTYGEDIADLVVPELPGKWSDKGARYGSASTAGRWARDDEAGRQWIALAYWMATETAGMDKDLDQQSAAVLAARDADAKKATAAKPTSTRGMIQPRKTVAQAAAAAGRKSVPDTDMRKCEKEVGGKVCGKKFHVKHGGKGGRPAKYCEEHRSR